MEPYRYKFSKTSNVIFLALLLCLGCALFPPRQKANGFAGSAGRGFLFDPDFSIKTFSTSSGQRTESYEINTGRLLAECVLVWSVSGLVLLYIWADN